MVKPSESAKTFQTVADDLFFLMERFGSHPDIPSMKTYQLTIVETESNFFRQMIDCTHAVLKKEFCCS